MIVLKDTEIKKIAKEKNIVLVGGCFDILHPAHIEFLKRAKEKGDLLVLFLESDENVKRLKGKKRPLYNQNTRAVNLSNLSVVDYVILLKTPDSPQYYYNLVNLLHPAIIAVTKGDPLIDVKIKQAEEVNGKVEIVMERDKGHSSTALAMHKK